MEGEGVGGKELQEAMEVAEGEKGLLSPVVDYTNEVAFPKKKSQ
jgi:hypothetical protein